jgi:hypothetical protein
VLVGWWLVGRWWVGWGTERGDERKKITLTNTIMQLVLITEEYLKESVTGGERSKRELFSTQPRFNEKRHFMISFEVDTLEKRF